jgi:predicted RNA-binding protein with PUA-like domain
MILAKQSRLSVSPVTGVQFRQLLKVAGADAGRA